MSRSCCSATCHRLSITQWTRQRTTRNKGLAFHPPESRVGQRLQHRPVLIQRAEGAAQRTPEEGIAPPPHQAEGNDVPKARRSGRGRQHGRFGRRCRFASTVTRRDEGVRDGAVAVRPASAEHPDQRGHPDVRLGEAGPDAVRHDRSVLRCDHDGSPMAARHGQPHARRRRDAEC